MSAAKPRRIAQVIGLPAENLKVYAEHHAAVWPGVLATLAAHGVRNYSIYRHGDVLFSYMEYVGDDFDADMAGIAADPVTQDWWKIMDPLQRPVDDRAEGEWWKTLPELFHMD